MIRLIQKSLLEKVRTDRAPFGTFFDTATALVGEEFSYQIVLYSDHENMEPYILENCSDLPAHIYRVDQVPIPWPHYQTDRPKDYITDLPGILPDRLTPIKDGDTLLIGPIPVVLWISFRTSFNGKFRCRFRIYSDLEEVYSNFLLEVLNFEPLPVSFKVYEHIYPTAIAESHHIPLFCDTHWELLGRYFELAAEHGVSDLLVPVFPSVYPSIKISEPIQLVEIKQSGNDLVFNYDLLDSYLCSAVTNGIRNFVFPPLFPDISKEQCLPFKLSVYDKKTPLFDTSTSCFDPEYRKFLCNYLRKLIKHILGLNLNVSLSFQLTDGVKHEDLSAYFECREMVYNIIKRFRILDPVSDVELYETKCFAAPFVPLEKMNEFLNASLHYPTFYFDPRSHSAPADLLIAGDSARLRLLGLLSFKYKLSGLFNRGFNFNDPWMRYPSGALSLVYPGEEGPLPSIRLKLLYYALQDLYALEALRKFLPDKRIFSMIDRVCSNKMNIFEFRDTINRLLIQYSKETRNESK